MKRADLIEIRNRYQENLDDLDIFRKLILSIEIKVKKIDLILNPKFHLTPFTDKKTGNRYLQAKVYWPDNEGKVTRSLSIFLGNVVNYSNGTDTVKKEIQNILMNKFGNQI